MRREIILTGLAAVIVGAGVALWLATSSRAPVIETAPEAASAPEALAAASEGAPAPGAGLAARAAAALESYEPPTPPAPPESPAAAPPGSSGAPPAEAAVFSTEADGAAPETTEAAEAAETATQAGPQPSNAAPDATPDATPDAARTASATAAPPADPRAALIVREPLVALTSADSDDLSDQVGLSLLIETPQGAAMALGLASTTPSSPISAVRMLFPLTEGAIDNPHCQGLLQESTAPNGVRFYQGAVTCALPDGRIALPIALDPGGPFAAIQPGGEMRLTGRYAEGDLHLSQDGALTLGDARIEIAAHRALPLTVDAVDSPLPGPDVSDLEAIDLYRRIGVALPAADGRAQVVFPHLSWRGHATLD